jgi:hypothetical protein
VNTDKEQNKIEKIRKYILKSGFPSEIEIGNILRKNGWIVVNQLPYIDKATKKIRTIDVSALKLGLQPPMTGFQLLIECKKSVQHEWVFHTQPKEGEFLPALVTIFELLKRIAQPPLLGKLQELANDYNLKKIFGLESSSLEAANKLSNLHILDKNIKIGVLYVNPDKKDDFFEATQQVLSALKSNDKVSKSFVVFPVIVFDGEIYEFYQEKDEMKVLPTNHLQFVSYDEETLPCMIDVVRKTYFSEFLQIIEKDFSIYNELMASPSKQ